VFLQVVNIWLGKILILNFSEKKLNNLNRVWDDVPVSVPTSLCIIQAGPNTRLLMLGGSLKLDQTDFY
jgi:hypothetical protein